MSKHNQYYSDWKESPDNDYYRDQAAHEQYAEERDASYWQRDSGELRDDTSYQNMNPRYVSNATDEPRFDENPDGYYPTPHHSSDYYDRESDRGFNLVNIADYRHSAYEENNHDETDYYASPQQMLPHDSQDLIGHHTMNSKSAGIQVVADDFVDTAMPSGGFRLPKAITIGGTMLFGVALAAWLLYSSQPDLSAADIVQMDSYDGQQETPAIFNLTDLKDCTSLRDCIKDSLAASKADIAKYTRETSALREIEIPAVNSAPVPAAVNAEIIESELSPVITVGTLPDQLQVKKQWSIIRSTPDSNGEIITSLAKGINVRIIGSAGSWYEIEAINAKRTRGFMHQSTVDSL